MNKKHHTLVDLSNVPIEKNIREELHEKYAPGLSIKNTTIILSNDITFFTLYQLGPNVSSSPFDNLGPVIVDGLNIEGNCRKILVFNKMISCQKKNDINLRDIFLKSKRRRIDIIKLKDATLTPQVISNLSE